MYFQLLKDNCSIYELGLVQSLKFRVVAKIKKFVVNVNNSERNFKALDVKIKGIVRVVMVHICVLNDVNVSIAGHLLVLKDRVSKHYPKY